MIFCHLAEPAIVLVFRMILSSENKRRDRKSSSTAHLELDDTAFNDMTDWENPNFRYVY